MMQRRKVLALGVGAALATPSLVRTARAQAPLTLRAHHFMAPSATLAAAMLRPWAKALETASNGMLKVEVFDAMALGGRAGDLIDQARDGVVDIALTLPGYTPGRFPRSEVFELPFIMTDSVATSRAFNRLIETDLQTSEYRGVKIIAGWVHGPGVIHSLMPIARLEDMRGRQVRGPTRVVNDLLAELGASPVGMPLPNVPEALAKGVVSAAVLPWEVTPSIKLAELVRHHTEFGPHRALYTATFVLAMEQRRYDRLPADIRDVLDAHSGDFLSKFAGQAMSDGDAPGRAAAVASGNSVVVLDASEVDRWQAASEPVMARWLADTARAGIDGSTLLSRARTLIAEMSV